MSGYFTHLTRVFWSFFLSIFSSRRRKHLSSPELPTFATNHESECDVSGGLGSWQKDKQQFLRRPSLIRASTRAREAREKKPHTLAPPPLEIYVEDWSSLGLNMTDLFETPSSAAYRSGAVESGVSTSHSRELAIVPERASEDLADDNFSGLPVSQPNTSSEHPAIVSCSSPGSPPSQSNTSSEHLATETLSSSGSPVSHSNDVKMAVVVALAGFTDTLHSKPDTESSIDLDQETQEAVVAEPATLSFSAGRYTSNAMSAVSGLLWDPPSFSISHSTPLPDVAPFPSKSRPQSTLALGCDNLVPYPDLFDFGMYARRISRDSFCETTELSSISVAFSVNEPSDKTRPISIYDVVHERDRYRSAAYSSCISSVVRTSPRRPPLASTLNLDSRRDTVDFSHEMFEKSDADESLTGNADIGAQLMIACDKLSRCGWTEEEFIKMFTSAATV